MVFTFAVTQLDIEGLGNQEAQFIGYTANHGRMKAFVAHQQKGIFGLGSSPGGLGCAGTPWTGPGRRPLWRPPIALPLHSFLSKVLLSGDKGLCENCEPGSRPSCLEWLA